MANHPDKSTIFSKLPEKVLAENQDILRKDPSGIGSNPLDVVFGSDLPDLQHKHHFLDNIRTYSHKPKLRKKLTAKERKKLGLFKLKPGNQRYESYQPLHHLWKQYMEDLLGSKILATKHVHDVELKIQKADLHGAVVMVTRSKCPSLVGTSGIVIQETKNTFKIVTEDDKLKTIPKENTVFTLTFGDIVATIFGNQIQYKASERANKKYKFRPTVDL